MTTQALTTQQSRFAAGDVVRLKSGGPAMTVVVNAQSQPGWVRCTWMQPPGHLMNTELAAEVLEPCEADAWPWPS